MRILIVEDSPTISTILKRKVENQLGYQAEIARCYREAQGLLADHAHEYAAALLDLGLPDAEPEAIVDCVVGAGVPSIVFTGVFNEEVRQRIWSKRVVDYVVKEGSQDVDYILTILQRIQKNKNVKVMIVDDSASMRKMLQDLLAIHQYQVITAKDGLEAMALLEGHPDTSLVITDFNMPKMSGFELTKRIRMKYSRRDLAIIGISAETNGRLSAQFIKCGANDFIRKPFSADEFYVRVTQNVELIEQVQQIKEMAFRDPLTGLRNRSFFWQAGDAIYQDARKDGVPLSVAMIDIDFFKSINDEFGHDVGDEALCSVAKIVTAQLKGVGIIARFGGEEFCILLPGLTKADAKRTWERVRQAVAATLSHARETRFRITVSVGVCNTYHESLAKMVTCADHQLYDAKRRGRNQTVMCS